MPDNVRTFSPPRRTFPTDGPFTREELLALPDEEIADIPVTEENVHQLAYFCDPIPNARIRTRAGSYMPTIDGLLNPTQRAHWFRDWPTQDPEKIRLLAENYVLHVAGNGHMRVYIPAVYWVHEGRAVRSGPFTFRPRLSTFHATDLWEVSTTEAIMNQSRFTRWNRMEHPHLNGGHACLGTEEAAYFNLREAGDLYGLAYLFENLVMKYNPASPFRHFMRQFPGETNFTPRLPGPVNIFMNTHDGYVRLNAFSVPLDVLDSVEYELLGHHIRVTSQEAQQLDRIHPAQVLDFLRDWFTTNTPDILNDPHTQKYRFANRILPNPNLRLIERLAVFGITRTAGFNDSDQELTALTIPYKKEHALEYPNENPDETTEANTGGEAPAETEANSSGTDAAEADPVAAGQELVENNADPIS